MSTPIGPTTKPCPADQAAPVAPVRSAFADAAMSGGLSAADAQALRAARRAEQARFVSLEMSL
jgi:hypothetical protein